MLECGVFDVEVPRCLGNVLRDVRVDVFSCLWIYFCWDCSASFGLVCLVLCWEFRIVESWDS
jgi:hypothetical protein